MEENTNMNAEAGAISVQTEHIFPIIKKWLYSEKEIFLREIVSNACDAVTKLRRLSSLGEVRDIADDFKIIVQIDKELRTLTVSDNGIGMTAEEIRKYICQMALSGALDFIKKYEGESENSTPDGIIGHFGLGFYSSFMVSSTVEIITKSYTNAPAVRWVCNEAGEYELSEADKAERGTDVIMHIADGEEEFLSEVKIREILDRFCAFMPVEIYLEALKSEDEEKAEKETSENDAEPAEKKPINDTNPLWQKNPSDCTEEEYSEFYKKVFNDFREPLFHVHINADYPLNFRGILYFPKLNHEYDSLEGQVKLFYNQVFVADNIKEVIPEYMLMLKGVLDCPELPLNVSRSYLQNNGYVSKISSHIVKKVADKINSLFNTERENFEKLWDDLKLFIEYASMRDNKFFDRIKSSILLPLTDGRHITIDEYLEKAKEKHENVIYYANDKTAQAQYISMFADQGIDVVLLDRILDTQFISIIEREKKVKYMRIDSDIANALKGDGESYESQPLSDLFVKESGNPELKIKFEALKDEKIPAILNISEESRRMDDMMKMYRMDGIGGMPTETTLVLNSNSSLIHKLGDSLSEGEETPKETAKTVKQIYTLALLSQRQLTADELKAFLVESFDIIEKSF